MKKEKDIFCKYCGKKILFGEWCSTQKDEKNNEISFHLECHETNKATKDIK